MNALFLLLIHSEFEKFSGSRHAVQGDPSGWLKPRHLVWAVGSYIGGPPVVGSPQMESTGDFTQ